MTESSFKTFLADDSGSYTVWFVCWFLLFSAFGGLTIDVSNALRNETLLQSTADSAALAGVGQLPGKADVRIAALVYARTNMELATNGNVVVPKDVLIGNWNADAEVFTEDATPLNAVYVTARRGDANQNPIATTFLRLIGIDRFNVQAAAVAVQYLPECLHNGLVARGTVDASSNNHFVNEICIHGQDHVEVQVNNGGPKDDCSQPGGGIRCWDEGVQVSMGDYDRWSNMDKFNNESDNPGLPPAMTEGDMEVSMVDDLPMIFDILKGTTPDGGLREAVIPDYITASKVVEIPDVDSFTAKIGELSIDIKTLDAYNPAAANPLLIDSVTVGGKEVSATGEGTIYHVKCKKPVQDAVTIPSGLVLKNIAIISDCRIKVGASVLTNVTLVALGGKVTKAGAPDLGDSNLDFTSGPVLGLADGCSPGGGARLFSNRSIHMASKMGAFGLQMVAAGDIHISAQAGAASGINAQAGGDIKLTSNNTYGICPEDGDSIFTSWYYRLVR